MEKLMKIPLYIPYVGVIICFILIIIGATGENSALLYTGIIVLHLFGWLLAAKFLLSGVSFFSSVLAKK